MSKLIQFDKFSDPQAAGSALRSGNPHCIACEQMLADAVDEVLSPADQAWFELHLAGCPECAQMVADARRGAAWLELLKTPRPEPSAQLLDRILLQTSMLQSSLLDKSLLQTSGSLGEEPLAVVPSGAFVVPAFAPEVFAPVLPFPRRRLPALPRIFFEPRLAMTAAMAFFSVALTLNLTGVRLDELHARDLSPTSLRKSYYQANANAVRFYDNLRVVHVLESRVQEVRDSNRDDVPASAPKPGQRAPKQDARPKARPDGRGVSRRNFTPANQSRKEGGLA